MQYLTRSHSARSSGERTLLPQVNLLGTRMQAIEDKIGALIETVRLNNEALQANLTLFTNVPNYYYTDLSNYET